MLDKLTIKNLFSIVVLMSLFSLMTGTISLIGLTQTNDALSTVYLDRTICIKQLGEIKAKVLANRLGIANSVAFKDEAQKHIVLIKQNLIDINKLWQEYRATKSTAEERRISDKFEKDLQHLTDEGLTPAIESLATGNTTSVDTLIKSIIRPLFVPIEDDINNLIQIQMDVSQQEFNDSKSKYDWNRSIILLILLIKLSLAIIILYYSKFLVKNVNKLISITKRITDGKLDVTFELSRQDEIGQLSQSIEQMQIALIKTRDISEQQDWLKTGIARINQIILGQDDKTKLASDVITEIANYLDAKVGAIYVVNDDKENLKLNLLGTYAYTQRKNLSSSFKLGESLVGQCALERKQILLKNTPEDYIQVVSGLGETAPRNICVTPILFDADLKGVIEIGSLESFSAKELEYLDEVVESIAVAFEITQAKMLMLEQQQTLQSANEELESQAKIVELSQQELRSQQTELQNINVELEAQIQRVKDSEVELKVQQEELELANSQLQTKNDLLEEQKSANEIARRDLAIQTEELTLASKYKSEFLANMSHELRTPLNSLLLLSRSLSENKTGNLSEDQVETAGVIYDSGSDLLNLINEILDLSKIESGKMDLRLQRIEISDLMRSINIQFAPMAKNQGLDLNINCAESTPTSIVTDNQRLGQVIKNLVGNALKFTETGSVSITFSPVPADINLSRSQLIHEKAIAIKVSDTGIGIPLDKQKIIFEAFQQADSGDRRRYGGTGLGLSISRELVNLLGGEIQLISEPGRGSTFCIYIPIETHNAESLQIETEKTTLAPYTSYKPQLTKSSQTQVFNQQQSSVNIDDDRNNINPQDRLLLIIEDDLRFAKIIANSGKVRGFKCLIALSGEEGLHLAKEYQPHGIILDIYLPNIDGWGVLNELKQTVNTRHIPVHIISSEDPSQDGLKIGAIGHLRKPVQQEEIEAVLNKIEHASSYAEKRVLVVEDDPIIRQETIRSITDGNIIIEAVDSGESALVALREHLFSLVILDLGLPDMQGMELLRTIANEKINMPPVIIYTVRELTKEEDEALRKYAKSIIIKDVRSQERLIDEVALFLHRVVNELPEDKKNVIRHLHESDDNLKGKKVLVVEDDMRTMFAMTKILAGHGLNPIKADNGKKALEILKLHPDVDLILMDMMMPEMDGYEASRRIRELPEFSHLPIIALTAKAMKEDRKKCLDAGASDYLSKPVDQDRLLSLIRVWLCR